MHPNGGDRPVIIVNVHAVLANVPTPAIHELQEFTHGTPDQRLLSFEFCSYGLCGLEGWMLFKKWSLSWLTLTYLMLA